MYRFIFKICLLQDIFECKMFRFESTIFEAVDLPKIPTTGDDAIACSNANKTSAIGVLKYSTILLY